MFDLERYREPVLSKVEAAIQYVETDRSTQQDTEETLHQNIDLGAPQHLSLFTPEKLASLEPLFSQLVIDCLALKVQEFDDSSRKTMLEESSLSRREIQVQITSSRERIEYFLKQHQEESQLFIETYQEEEEELEAYQPT
jgi:hypothetical protein